MAPTGTIIITGANGGLGSATVSRIISDTTLAQGQHGLYTLRNTQKPGDLQPILQNGAHKGHTYDLVELDLSDLSSVRNAATEINRRVQAGDIPPIRALILNAAMQEYTTQTITKAGFDVAFQVNYLGHFLLTLLLLQSLDKESGRVVVLGSWSHDTADPRNKTGPLAQAYSRSEYETIFTKDPWNGEDIARGRWSSAEKHPDDIEAGYRRYGASKLCEIMMMRELSRRIAADPTLSRVSVIGVDPGAMPTGLGRNGTFVLRMIFKVVLPLISPIMSALNPAGDIRTTSQSASDVVKAAFDQEEPYKLSGTYMNGSVIGDVGPEAKDEAKCQRLWAESLTWSGIRDTDTIIQDWR